MSLLFQGGYVDHCMRLAGEAIQAEYRIANINIFAAYYAIPLAILFLRFARPDLIDRWVAWMFAAFIFSCGTSHMIMNLVLTYDWYEFQAHQLAATALISDATAVIACFMLAKLLKAPSVEQYEAEKKKVQEREILLHSTEATIGDQLSHLKREDLENPEQIIDALEAIRENIRMKLTTKAADESINS
jgi:hypothetical protein